MIDFSLLDKVAEYRNGELQWLEGRDINAIYIILIGNEYYIGSSRYVYLRIGQHLRALLSNSHHSIKLQDKFRAVHDFDVYVLERGIDSSKLLHTEEFYIKKFKPTLNVVIPSNNGLDIKERIKEQGWTISRVAEHMTNKRGEKGISQSSLSQMIAGNPTVSNLQEIASIIGLSLSELVSDNSDADFIAFVRNNGQIHTFDNKEDLKDFVNELCGEYKMPVHKNIRGKEYYQ